MAGRDEIWSATFAQISATSHQFINQIQCEIPLRDFYIWMHFFSTRRTAQLRDKTYGRRSAGTTLETSYGDCKFQRAWSIIQLHRNVAYQVHRSGILPCHHQHVIFHTLQTFTALQFLYSRAFLTDIVRQTFPGSIDTAITQSQVLTKNLYQLYRHVVVVHEEMLPLIQRIPSHVQIYLTCFAVFSVRPLL